MTQSICLNPYCVHSTNVRGQPSDLLSFPLKFNDWYSLKLELCRQPYILQDACEELWIKACFTHHSRMRPHTNVWRAAFCSPSRLCIGVEYAKRSIFSVHLILKSRGSFKILGKQFPHWLLVCDLMSLLDLASYNLVSLFLHCGWNNLGVSRYRLCYTIGTSTPKS